MPRQLPVKASSLHQRDTIVGGHLIPKATIFPFFEPGGFVEHLLIVDPVSIELSVCKPEDVIRLPWYRAIEISEATPLNRSGLTKVLGNLLHFDPWWLLKVEPFPMLEETPILKATNCVDDFRQETNGLSYTGDLTTVKTAFTYKADDYSSRTYTSSLLKPRRKPAPDPSRYDSGQSSGWTLQPFWES